MCFLVRTVFYATALPVWEGFDEWSHFAVIQRMAFRGEELVARDSPVSRAVKESLELCPVPWELRRLPWPSVTQDIYWRLPVEERIRRENLFKAIPAAWAKEDSIGSLRAYEALQPPLYGWLMVPVLRILNNTDIGEQVISLRWLSLAIASLTIPLTFLIGRSVFRDQRIGLGCAAVVACMPEFAINVARVGNECVAVVLFTVLTLLALELVRTEIRYSRALYLGVVLGAGLISKAYFLTAALAIGLLLFSALLRDSGHRLRVLGCTAIIGAVSVSISGWWYWYNLLTTRTVSGLNEAVMLRERGSVEILQRAADVR